MTGKFRGTSFYRGTTVRPVRDVANVARHTCSLQGLVRFTRLERGLPVKVARISLALLINLHT